jgi:rSAM/selenodomain-associated transferase 2
LWWCVRIDTQISVIIPVFNEAEGIDEFLAHLNTRTQIEVIVVDGGSTDKTLSLMQGKVDSVISTTLGRAHQMNVGAEQAQGEVLLFLHSDTYLPLGWDKLILKSKKNKNLYWGRFDVHLDGQAFIFSVIAFFINLRSRLTGIVTGDQAIFISRTLFKKVGGFAEIPLMEDVLMSKTLKKYIAPTCLFDKVSTSSRRWQKHGVWKTICTMWFLRLSYFFGVSADRLHRIYYKNTLKVGQNE